MSKPIIGWESETPCPNHQFNQYLHSREGRLYLEDLDLAQLLLGGENNQGLGKQMASPLEIIYLPIITQKIRAMYQIFAEIINEVGYNGKFYYSYASKANTAEEVVRTTLQANAHYEMSSVTDVTIATLMKQAGYITAESMIIANGFKTTGSEYAAALLQLKTVHPNTIPVIEDLSELDSFKQSSHLFELGLRQKSYGVYYQQADMEKVNSRFGLTLNDLQQAATEIAAAPNLKLKLYHAMIGSQITPPDEFVARLSPAIEVYAKLRQEHASLDIFDFGGGMPVAHTLNFNFDYHAFARLLLTTFQKICAAHNVPVPHIMGEFGRYTTAEHGVHIFKIITTKYNNSTYPWYILDGSIMTSFPDSWALGEHFVVLPLNHLDKPFQQVQLGGITCDSDDVYPPKSSTAPLYLPIETDNLYIGFFNIGAYQEMLGGVRGSKHCVLPEATEIVVNRNQNGTYQFDIIPGQTIDDVLRNLGYLDKYN